MAGGVDNDPNMPGQPTEQSGDDIGSADKAPSDDKTSRRRKAPSKSPNRRSKKDPDAVILQSDIDRLEARLKRADATTRKSVKSLETIVAALEASLEPGSENQTEALASQVKDLSHRLERQADSMKAAVRRELRAAIADGGLEGLDAALGRASAHMGEAELAQSDAITKVNRHLADIARAVDTRLKRESHDRKSELDAVASRLAGALKSSVADLDRRVGTVEQDSADAFDKVGDTIERIHDRLEQRRQTLKEDMAGKINDLALRTQAEFKTYQAEIDTRFQETESRYLAVGTGAAEKVVERVGKDVDHRIGGLEKRIKDLESGKTLPKSEAAELPVPFPPLPNMPDSDAAIDHAAEPNPVHAMTDRLGDMRPAAGHAMPARSGGLATALKPTETFEPFAQPPQTFDPPPAPVLPFPAAPQAEMPASVPMPPFQMPSSLPPLPPVEDFMPAPLPDAVFDNPAYAEGVAAAATVSESPKAVRVADDGGFRNRLPSLSMPNRTVRIALLATGVAVVALFAVRTILGSDGPVDTRPVAGGSPVVIDNTPPTPAEASPFYTPPASAVADPGAPIGDYVENQPVEIDPASLETLDAAVAAGNPIAQFQKGLAELEAGNTQAGAALIRQAASANQPAALYRLAKLYEAGEGVPRDDVMARQLIERAARGGNRIAMHDLALYYTEGRGGVALDMVTAKSWFEQAARRGVVDSQFNLAVLSENTEIGLEPDLDEALFWYSIAATQGDQFAISRRDTLRASMDADRLSRIDTRIEAFSPRAVEEEANGIFNNVPWMRSAALSGPELVMEAQSLLASLGYEVGTPDGVMGQRTRTAISEFQRANNVPQTGEVNAALIDRLSQAARS